MVQGLGFRVQGLGLRVPCLSITSASLVLHGRILVYQIFEELTCGKVSSSNGVNVGGFQC